MPKCRCRFNQSPQCSCYTLLRSHGNGTKIKNFSECRGIARYYSTNDANYFTFLIKSRRHGVFWATMAFLRGAQSVPPRSHRVLLYIYMYTYICVYICNCSHMESSWRARNLHYVTTSVHTACRVRPLFSYGIYPECVRETRRKSVPGILKKFAFIQKKFVWCKA